MVFVVGFAPIFFHSFYFVLQLKFGALIRTAYLAIFHSQFPNDITKQFNDKLHDDFLCASAYNGVVSY